MYNNLIAFENKHIPLSSLVGNLEFLFSILESVDEEWCNKFFEEISNLEIINAREIVNKSGKEYIPDIEDNKKQKGIASAISNIKKLISVDL
jgi:hypothetical protein